MSLQDSQSLSTIADWAVLIGSKIAMFALLPISLSDGRTVGLETTHGVPNSFGKCTIFEKFGFEAAESPRKSVDIRAHGGSGCFHGWQLDHGLNVDCGLLHGVTRLACLSEYWAAMYK